MLKVKNGEHHKLGLLYERYKKRLFGYFYHMNKDAGLSEDLVQNVFVRVLKYKHTYTEESKFITWIFQIARNEGYDYYRKQKKHQHQDIDEVGYNLNHSDDFQQKMEVLEKKTILKRAMEQLSSEKREVLTLSKFKELKYKEVGEIIGCTEGAARTKVHRALFELKEIYLTLEKR
ncbi:RNA polymerase sigma factor [Tenacibaculum aiptasiae]|uniref:RNA polymerase sigma factor n=2 Tax=Flavobacteriaceae TaxID=49546 RepID=A0A7J5AAU2_9FLAO|nr:RNA polymerase sigma factor [Tenacibaculum aiptasiae]